MGHSLSVEVNAEGVETADQLEVLRGLDCDVAQGFLLGRPGSPEQIESLVHPDETREMGPATERAAPLH